MPYTLLLVDDESDFRSEFCECFSEYEIIEASDGEAALDILEKPNVVDVVILDVMMPGLRGTEVLAKIKSIRPDIKVVIMTGNSTEDIAISALKNRADEYVEKPLVIENVKKVIAKMTDEKDMRGIEETGSIEEKIEKVKIFVERNVDKKTGLTDAANHAGMSAKYLSRVFERLTGTGFSEFKEKVSVKRAVELLKKGFNINQISDKTGYANTESFIRMFKKVTGSTPAAYRNGAKKTKKKRKGKS